MEGGEYPAPRHGTWDALLLFLTPPKHVRFTSVHSTGMLSRMNNLNILVTMKQTDQHSLSSSPITIINLLLCACVVRSCPDVSDVHLYQLRMRSLKPEPAVQWFPLVLLTYICQLKGQWTHLCGIRAHGMFYCLVTVF